MTQQLLQLLQAHAEHDGPGRERVPEPMRYAHLAPERLRSAVTRLEGFTSSRPATESTQASTHDACSPEGGFYLTPRSNWWAVRTRTVDPLIKRNHGSISTEDHADVKLEDLYTWD